MVRAAPDCGENSQEGNSLKKQFDYFGGRGETFC